MKNSVFVTGFALFALFFGAGNLALPPSLGYFSGEQWPVVFGAFALSAVIIPLLGIFAHARLQGSLLSFGNRISPLFSLIFCVLIYIIAIALPSPRTAAMTHEMSIEPYFEVSTWVTSSVYFFLVFLFSIKRSTVLNNVGKILTPLILLVLGAIVVNFMFFTETSINHNQVENPFKKGFLEGYHTFDAIGAMVVGGVIIISLKLKGVSFGTQMRKMVIGAGVIAASFLSIIYSTMIWIGSTIAPQSPDPSRNELLLDIASRALDSNGQMLLAALVALACFTTAVGIITGAGDFLKEVLPFKYTYEWTVLLSCIAGVIFGHLSFDAIIALAVPVLDLLYPLVIALILLNTLSQKFRTKSIMTAVVIVVIICSLPTFISHFVPADLGMKEIGDFLPLNTYGIGWLLPGIIIGLVLYFINSNLKNS